MRRTAEKNDHKRGACKRPLMGAPASARMIIMTMMIRMMIIMMIVMMIMMTMMITTMT